MTTLLPAGVQSFLLPHSAQYPMAEGVNDVWRGRQHYHPMSLPVDHYWPDSNGLPMSSVHDTDLRMFHSDSADYHSSFNGDAGSLISPHMGYVPDTNWGSDMDIGTPSTAGFPSDVVDGYHNMRHTSNPSHHLNLPAARHERVDSTAHSPQSSHGNMSPHQPFAKLPDVAIKEERPNLIRSITAPAAPDHRPRRTAVLATSGTPSVKRSGSEDEDDEYIPSEDTKPRGRKRQRIPHTAVERRYRENLNAHLDKLRQTVPSLASKRSAGASKPGDGLGEGVKPSKCEILNGAIEHIGALGKENSALKTEVQALRSRLEDLERWCSASFGK